MPRSLPVAATLAAAVVLACCPARGQATPPAGLDTVVGVAAVATSSAMPARVAASPLGVMPARAVPAYVTTTQLQARTQAGSGGPDVAFDVRRPTRATALMGDWWGEGAETLATFQGGSWVLQRSNVAGRSDSSVRITFGVAGDQPVAGDWDGDGRTDIAVRHGRTWHFAKRLDLTRTSVPVWRTVRFGDGRGVAVAGNWRGPGDGFGTYRKGEWLLRSSPTHRRAGIRRVRFGGPGRNLHRAGDIPVVGDWDGDGTDGLGVVRGSTWRLSPGLTGGAVALTVPRPATGQPTPWSTPAGARGQACPTAGTGFRSAGWDVAESSALDGVGTPSLPGSGLVQKAMWRSERFMLGGLYEEGFARQRNRLFADVRGTDPREEYSVRRAAMAALTVSIALATGNHDDARVLRTRAEAVAYVDFLLRSLGCQHRSVSPGGWGHAPQSAHWATLLGLAAWLVWDDLSPQTRLYVASTVEDEARTQLFRAMEYWKDADGRVLPGREGNTAAEEVAWNSAVLELAARMDPTNPRVDAFRAQGVQLAAVSYSTPTDLVSDEVVNGVPLADRLEGTNALDDGTVVNHDLVHPDYMGNIQHLWWSADFAVLAGGSLPEAYLHHADLVYGAFSIVHFEPGQPSAADRARAYGAPGGTIYRPHDDDPNAMYFPDGSDWGSTRRAPFMSIDAHALAYGLAPPEAWDPAAALAAHTRGQLDLGAGYADGRTYSPDPALAVDQDRYVGREEYAAQQVATAWLALCLGELGPPGVDDSTYPVPRVSTTEVRPSAPRGLTDSP